MASVIGIGPKVYTKNDSSSAAAHRLTFVPQRGSQSLEVNSSGLSYTPSLDRLTVTEIDADLMVTSDITTNAARELVFAETTGTSTATLSRSSTFAVNPSTGSIFSVGSALFSTVVGPNTFDLSIGGSVAPALKRGSIQSGLNMHVDPPFGLTGLYLNYFSAVTSAVIYAWNFVNVSDERIKRDIVKIESPSQFETVFDLIDDIGIYNYAYKPGCGFDPDQHVYGYIAQEVKKNYPQASITQDSYTTQGGVTIENFVAVSKERLGQLNFAGTIGLIKKNRALEAEIDQLNAKYESLLTRIIALEQQQHQ